MDKPIERLTSAKPILKVIEEWKRGPERFLKLHGTPSKSLYLVIDGEHYDLKPIMAAAYKRAYPKSTPITARSFHSGVATSVARRLGLTVINISEAAEPEPDWSFDPKDLSDGRKRILTALVQRQGQGAFRANVLHAYGSRCAVSGCIVEEAIDAAHISPYLGPNTNHVTNGIPLRADIHTLFDRYRLTVDKEFRVVLSTTLKKSEYWAYEGRKLHLPPDPKRWPNGDALEEHRSKAVKPAGNAGWKRATDSAD